jgi:hypothetical protein
LTERAYQAYRPVSIERLDEALIDAFRLFKLLGKPALVLEGRLRSELLSMAAVEAQRPDAAHDSANPPYPISFGLAY